MADPSLNKRTATKIRSIGLGSTPTNHPRMPDIISRRIFSQLCQIQDVLLIEREYPAAVNWVLGCQEMLKVWRQILCVILGLLLGTLDERHSCLLGETICVLLDYPGIVKIQCTHLFHLLFGPANVSFQTLCAHQICSICREWMRVPSIHTYEECFGRYLLLAVRTRCRMFFLCLVLFSASIKAAVVSK